MQRLYIGPTTTTPEVNFSPDENIFLLHGASSPEDVRAMYYPVIDWLRTFIDDILTGGINIFTSENPLRFQIDMDYFNSSSAKFLADIFQELKRLSQSAIPVVVQWYYNEEDMDMKEAGSDISLLTGLKFSYIAKN